MVASLKATSKGNGAAIFFLRDITVDGTEMSSTMAKGSRWMQLEKEVNPRLLDFCSEEFSAIPQIATWELTTCQKVEGTRMTKSWTLPSNLSSIFICFFVYNSPHFSYLQVIRACKCS